MHSLNSPSVVSCSLRLPMTLSAAIHALSAKAVCMSAPPVSDTASAPAGRISAAEDALPAEASTNAASG